MKQIQKDSRTRKRIKNSREAFPKCPSCLYSCWLTHSVGHVFCDYCDWNSINAWVEAGGEDFWEASTKRRRILAVNSDVPQFARGSSQPNLNLFDFVDSAV